ncbi:hypothetical protein [Nonomuraea sp. NPDC049400]|uniref:hypothetical protein n=1 Tax=Nonomuraea sp. NPDC049400 TaxID=3364352 RepID=UPI00379B11F5
MLAVLTVVGDVVPEQLKWAGVLAGVGLLVFRMTVPEGSAWGQVALHDRTAFDAVPPAKLFGDAKQVWIFAPSGVNLLSEQNCQLLRRTVLARPDGVLRIVVLDPGVREGVVVAGRQLDDGLDPPLQPFATALEQVAGKLRNMRSWQVAGSFDFRMFPYNPGFSLVAVDPGERNGKMIVEFHGVGNETVAARMHIELTRDVDERWYTHWLGQFDELWKQARESDGAP